ncbi:hypothetical protein Hypma_012847 [Hypsizygus marmoreus]|uniref:RRM domain-containing protein n=1 Tax=Hypsizygus marmoreus TaxID=39966 RepID=A0A369JKR7_HYPMA|nr:hypothetical protein Hypma_012847 [Hypsizygus marmoreus]
MAMVRFRHPKLGTIRLSFTYPLSIAHNFELIVQHDAHRFFCTLVVVALSILTSPPLIPVAAGLLPARRCRCIFPATFASISVLRALNRRRVHSRTPQPPGCVYSLTDEDYINKSLLESLDAQADAEPVSSSDPEQVPVPSYGSTSNSSSGGGSPSVPYHIAMHAHQQALAHPDSPVEHLNHQHIHPQDPIYAPQNMYTSPSVPDSAPHIHPDFASDHDARKFHSQQQQKLDGFSNQYRSTFSSYPNTTRPRNQTARSGLPPPNQYREPTSYYPTSAADVFPSSMTSPVQSHMQAFEHRPVYDFSGGQVNLNGNAPKSYFELYNPAPTMLPPHHINGTKPQQQSQHTAYSAPFPSGPHLSSQTPYGPHVPAAAAAPSAINGTSANTPGASTAQPNVSSTNAPNPAGSNEEISTIFVVGFPEDMQEREFQNMFTFSPDFEAATLKIPNKEYTAYGGIGGPGGSAGLRSGGAAGGFGPYGANDPYNVVTVNQGGVVVDAAGREGTITSWPATVPGDDLTGGHFTGGAAGGGQNMAPRKQIIGFAKFKTRDAALLARDGLQGRRVDIDKGAVLKAEMAKKNLHTKRGVGPVPGGTATAPTPGVPGAGGLQQALMNAGIGAGISEPFNVGGNEMIGMRERELGALRAMGLGADAGRLSQWRDHQDQLHSAGTNGMSVSDREDEERRLGLINAMGGLSFGSATRGPRERAEDDERERRRKDMRLRAGNSTAYDAFHSVPSGPVATPALGTTGTSRHMTNINGNGLLSPTEDDVGGTSPMMTNAFANPHAIGFSQGQHEELPGPWDNVRTRSTHPRSSSQRSFSPPLPVNGSSNPFFDEAPRSLSPNSEQHQQHLQFLDQSRRDPRINEQYATSRMAPSESSASSVVGGSTGRSTGSASDVGRADSEMARALGGLDVNTDDGKTSPQLPSPASGASSRNGVDQNPPINTLYVGNLPTAPPPSGFPQDHLEESLRELFSARAGFRRLCFRHKSNGPMCFVEFEDVAYATKALNDLYGNTLKGLVKGGIRLSYSKNPLGVRTPTSAGSGPSLQQQQLQSNTVTNSPNPSYPSTFAPDFQSRSSEEQQRAAPATLRRDMIVTSPPPGLQLASDLHASSPPPPRFYPSSSSGSGFGGTSGTMTMTAMSNAFIPRYGFGLQSNVTNGQSTTFSPFGLSNTPPPHNTIPDHHTTSGDHISSSHSQHFVHNGFAPANNLEAARAG